MNHEYAESEYLATHIERNESRHLDATQQREADKLAEAIEANLEAVDRTTDQATRTAVKTARPGRKPKRRIRATRGALEAILVTLDWESERMVKGVHTQGDTADQMGVVTLDMLDWVDDQGRPVNRNRPNHIKDIYRHLWNPVDEGVQYATPYPGCDHWKGLKPSSFNEDWQNARTSEYARRMAEADLDKLVVDDSLDLEGEDLQLADFQSYYLGRIEKCYPSQARHRRVIKSQRKILVPVNTLEKVRACATQDRKSLIARTVVQLYLDGVPIIANVVKPVLERMFNESLSTRTINRHLAEMGFVPTDRTLHNPIWTPRNGALAALLAQGVVYPTIRGMDDLRACYAILRADGEIFR
jgi:hypothetical protein